MGNIFNETKKTKEQNKKIMERKIKNQRPKGEITTYASYGLTFYGTDENGGCGRSGERNRGNRSRRQRTKSIKIYIIVL